MPAVLGAAQGVTRAQWREPVLSAFPPLGTHEGTDHADSSLQSISTAHWSPHSPRWLPTPSRDVHTCARKAPELNSSWLPGPLPLLLLRELLCPLQLAAPEK